MHMYPHKYTYISIKVEVQQFQLQKQATLNQIGIVVPLKISQLYAFHGSGGYTGPTDGDPNPLTMGGSGLVPLGSISADPGILGYDIYDMDDSDIDIIIFIE